MKTWTISIALGGVLAASTAHADQCQWVSDAQAAKARAILAKQPKVIAFCEPCGDKAPGAPEIAKSVSVATPEAGYKEVSINGEEVDLAYTFVKTESGDYKNIAKLVGCPADGVSAKLKVEDETPTGVIISPDVGRPAEQPAPPNMEIVESIPAIVEQPPVAEPSAPQRVVVYSRTITTTPPWFAIALACLGGFAGGLAGMFVAAKLRKRRELRPRAVELTHKELRAQSGLTGQSVRVFARRVCDTEKVQPRVSL